MKPVLHPATNQAQNVGKKQYAVWPRFGRWSHVVCKRRSLEVEIKTKKGETMEKIDRNYSIAIIIVSLLIGFVASAIGSLKTDSNPPLLHISVDHTDRMVYTEEK